ncbi:hypothetical protein K438DRAFT_1967607 [Mycena galopus ATCC 62051]|nr:hypothetical protein K438DRAFT_1967607 [Mycena galopus ATCC 62051]
MAAVREFTTPRLCSAHGYDEPSQVEVAFQRRLPRFSSLCARVVQQERRNWIVWSPNSQQNPFYPGHRVPIPGLVVLPSKAEQRRYDGHGGRWDFSRIPQVFSPARPWLGLMKREGRHLETEFEFTPPYSVWNVQAHEINREYIDLLITRNAALEEAMSLRIPTAQRARPSLYTLRPVFPKLQSLNDLKIVKTFDKAVDKLGECQRGMREKQAWVTLVSLLVEFPLESETRYGPEVKAADDSRVGVWINGAEDPMVNWMLTKGAVPCFLVAAPPRGVLLEHPRDGFSSGTEVEELSLPTYAYDQVARAQNLEPMPSETNPLFADLIVRHDVDAVASNPHWQLELPWAYLLFSSDGRMEAVDYAISVLSVPSIAPNANTKGVWEVYAEEELEFDEPDLGPIMRLRPKKGKGKTDQGEDDEMWYDRQLKRKLIFHDLPPLPAGSVVLEEEFGRPVPSWPFGARANNEWMGKPPSIWMYRCPEASKNRVGEQFHYPTPPREERMEVDVETAGTQLLRLDSTSRTGSAEPRLETPHSAETQSQPQSPAISDSSMVSLGDELSDEETRDDPMPNLFAPGVEVEMASVEREGPEENPESTRMSSPYRDSQGDETPHLLGRITSEDERALLQRLDVRLGERVSDLAPPAKKRKHNPAGKRKAWIARMEEIREPAPEIFEELEEWETVMLYIWADDEIDWFINMEEGDPSPDAHE